MLIGKIHSQGPASTFSAVDKLASLAFITPNLLVKQLLVCYSILGVSRARHGMNTVFSILLGGLLAASSSPTAAQAPETKIYFPNKVACPVTPDLFPTQAKLGESSSYVFSENDIVRRISIALISPNGSEVNVKFVWVGAKAAQPPHINWGEHSGFFRIKGDGKPSCFFLGQHADIPENIPCQEFRLELPAGITGLKVGFSSKPSEIVMKTCPMPELGKTINNAIEDSRINFGNDGKTTYALQLLEKAVPKYDCRRNYDYEPIPAWWMADYKMIDDWIEFIHHEVLAHNDYALRVYVEYLATSDGYRAEGMLSDFWGILIGHPLYVLKNWDRIREFRKEILGSVYFQEPGSGDELVSIYRKVSEEYPIYKSAFDEIAETVKQLLKEIRSCKELQRAG